MNISFINLPVPGQVDSQVHNGANMTNVVSTCSQSGENGRSKITADGANMTNVQSAFNQPRENSASDMAVDGAQGSSDGRNQEQLCQESSILCQFREMQRRQIDFIKKRVSLLEKCLNDEYQKEYFVSALMFHFTQSFWYFFPSLDTREPIFRTLKLSPLAEYFR